MQDSLHDQLKSSSEVSSVFTAPLISVQISRVGARVANVSL